jgi:two-component system chemotaxis response regulator CheB
MITVLVVDDSAQGREYLVPLLDSDRELRVAAAVNAGPQALAAVVRYRPDVVVMAVSMPDADGVLTTRLIMESTPTPVVVVSGTPGTEEAALAACAMEAGAVALVRKPGNSGHSPEEAAAFLRCVRSMAEVKVVRRWKPAAGAGHDPLTWEPPLAVELIAIGASTGGPPVLQAILARLPEPFPIPIAIVQHMAAGFIEGFVHWLAGQTRHAVSVARDGEAAEPGRIYVAPEGGHLEFTVRGRMVLRRHSPEHGHAPSVSRLFRSAAEAYGPAAAGVLLTGMGQDGADGLRIMRECGALTIVQDRESSVVYGMAAEAVSLDAARLILPPEQIATALARLAPTCCAATPDRPRSC